MNLRLRQRCFFARPPLNSSRLCIRGLGICDVLPPCCIDRPRGTDDYLFLCTHDELEISEDGSSLRPGEMVIWAPGMRQFYRNRNGLRHTWLHGDGLLMRELLGRSGLAIGQAIAPGSVRCTERMFGAIFDELQENGPDEDIIAHLLNAWLLALARCQRGSLQPAMPEPYASLKRMIEERFASTLSLEGLARQAGVSVQHFARNFKKLVGESPIAYQMRLRMERAAWLLRDRERSVGSVGEEVGYADLYQFSRAFSRHFGCSPRDWRKRTFSTP